MSRSVRRYGKYTTDEKKALWANMQDLGAMLRAEGYDEVCSGSFRRPGSQNDPGIHIACGSGSYNEVFFCHHGGDVYFSDGDGKIPYTAFDILWKIDCSGDFKEAMTYVEEELRRRGYEI